MFAEMFDVDKLLLNRSKIDIKSPTKPGNDLIPKEATKDDKKAGWIETDYVRVARVIPLVFKDIDNLLQNKFQGNENMKDCNRKCFKNCLTMHRLIIPEN